jgi:hypothetical protein
MESSQARRSGRTRRQRPCPCPGCNGELHDPRTIAVHMARLENRQPVQSLNQAPKKGYKWCACPLHAPAWIPRGTYYRHQKKVGTGKAPPARTASAHLELDETDEASDSEVSLNSGSQHFDNGPLIEDDDSDNGIDVDMDIPTSSKAAIEDDQAHTFESLREFMYQEAAAADQIHQEWLDNLMDKMDERHIEGDNDDIYRTKDFDSESSDSDSEDSTLQDDGDKDVDIPFSKSCKLYSNKSLSANIIY